jgi:catechol 2,3-dioxygenase-like lactoylglutathione lyase family enzyme
MALRARYAHTNLVARDWRALARFYEAVFGCVIVGPERDLSGEWLARGTGVERAHLRGVHLRLPGHGDDGPTLEIFSYDDVVAEGRPVANRAGFGHVAFAVDDVERAVRIVVEHGGTAGPVVSEVVPGAGRLDFAYVRDPEDNIVELQRWR